MVGLEIQLAVARGVLAGRLKGRTLEALVQAEVDRRTQADEVEQAVWDPALNSTKRGGGTLMFDPFKGAVGTTRLHTAAAGVSCGRL